MLIRCVRNFSRSTILPASVTTTIPFNTSQLFDVSTSPAALDFRTSETNTNAHSERHLGRFYRIPAEDKKLIFSSRCLPKSFETQTKTFGETCLMIREPAIEILNYIKSSNLKNPTIRYLLYGENGVGKSLAMAHVLHYGLQNNFLLLHVPWPSNWYKRPKEKANSTLIEGFVDLPFDAAAWLVHFKTQNAKLLPQLDLKTSKEYIWSKRETSPMGISLSELVEHGIARVKFAADTIAALITEIKQHATAGRCKVMVAIDGFNVFFHPVTRILSDNKSIVPPNKITLTQPFLDITNYDWCNGVCILSVDKIAMTEGFMESEKPRYLLGKDGFEHLDPFIPIRVENYNEKEFTCCINYYLDRRWIQNRLPGFDMELKYLSAKNPFKLMNICAPL